MLLFAFLKNEILLIYRSKFNFFISYIFFILMVFIFPLSFSYDSEIINYFLPVIIWISVIISSLISIEYNYRDEYENGYIDNLILSSNRLILVLYSKIIIGWLANGVPIAKGEVVMVGERFGVRFTEVTSPEDTVRKL